MNNSSKNARRSMILAMLIFGTIGIFRKYIPISSSMLAMLRGFIGMGFLLLLIKCKGQRIDRQAVKNSAVPLVVSGIFIGLNWILLFEAYRFTSVAVATLCYYMAPILVILASPLLLGERITRKKMLCVIAAFIGMIFVSGVLDTSSLQIGELKGILLGLGAACLYACVILMNKKMAPVPAYDKTIVQLGSAAVVLLPYNLILTGAGKPQITAGIVLLVLIVGIVHTGIAYALYFGSMERLKAQTIALYSYIDPVTAILLSLLIFHEKMGIQGWVGAVLILGSTLISDLLEKEP